MNIWYSDYPKVFSRLDLLLSQLHAKCPNPKLFHRQSRILLLKPNYPIFLSNCILSLNYCSMKNFQSPMIFIVTQTDSSYLHTEKPRFKNSILPSTKKINNIITPENWISCRFTGLVIKSIPQITFRDEIHKKREQKKLNSYFLRRHPKEFPWIKNKVSTLRLSQWSHALISQPRERLIPRTRMEKGKRE